MKLYATVMSERAQKGQGGKYLNIQVQGEDGIILARLLITQSEVEPDMYEMSIENRSPYLTIVEGGIEIGTKGEKEKGEKTIGRGQYLCCSEPGCCNPGSDNWNGYCADHC